METHFIAVGLLYFVATILAEQLPYPLQLFYLSPNSVALLPPTPVVRSLKDEAVVEGEASQFHSQDNRGRALFGYTTPDQARIEARSEDGSVRGSYSYLDAWGKAVKVQYWDDGTGFHAAGNNLPGLYASEIPQPVQDTPEVIAAKQQHFLLFQQALAAAVESGEVVTNNSTKKPAVEYDQEGVIVESEDPNSVPEDDIQELTRYPNLQNFPQNLYDPTQVHDANREAVIVDNPDITARAGKTLQNSPVAENKPPAGFFYSFRYAVPMYVQVKTLQDGVVPEEDKNENKKKVSVSQKAALFGAIPVAAVHDVQVPPYLRDSIKNFQVMPLYVET